MHAHQACACDSGGKEGDLRGHGQKGGKEGVTMCEGDGGAASQDGEVLDKDTQQLLWGKRGQDGVLSTSVTRAANGMLEEVLSVAPHGRQYIKKRAWRNGELSL